MKAFCGSRRAFSFLQEYKMPLAQLPYKHESMEINLHFSLSDIKFTLVLDYFFGGWGGVCVLIVQDECLKFISLYDILVSPFME